MTSTELLDYIGKFYGIKLHLNTGWARAEVIPSPVMSSKGQDGVKGRIARYPENAHSEVVAPLSSAKLSV